MDQTGPSVVQLMQSQAVSFGTVFLEDLVDTVDLTTQPFTLRTKTTGQEVKTRAMIVATRADARWLGVEGEHRLRGGGVSTCATCDGFLFRDQDVVRHYPPPCISASLRPCVPALSRCPDTTI